jgi:hypothetical protein
VKFGYRVCDKIKFFQQFLVCNAMPNLIKIYFVVLEMKGEHSNGATPFSIHFIVA